MTFFKNRTVFFFDFNFLKGSVERRTRKQKGKITKAIDALNVINEDITAKNLKTRERIEKLAYDNATRNVVKSENKTVLYHLKRAL